MNIVEPLNNRQIGTRAFVRYSEVSFNLLGDFIINMLI